MSTRVMGPKGSRRRKRFLLAPMLLVALAAFFVIAGAQANNPEQANYFELDKNLQNDVSTTLLGSLGGNINATQTSFTVCQAVTGAPAGPYPITIQIDAEQMTVATVTTLTGGGCSGAFKRSYSGVIRHTNGAAFAASHGASGVSGYVTQIGPPPPVRTGDDWDQVKAAVDANNALPPAQQADNPCAGSNWTGNAAAKACDFIADPPGQTVFTTGGSKDDLDINTGVDPNITHNWMYTNSSVPDADDITDGYAVKYEGPNPCTTGQTTPCDHQFLFFGADRTAVNGSKDFGFWFFRSPVSLNGDGTFNGTHTVGDILLLGTFTGGGATTNIRIFSWHGPGGAINGVLDPQGAFGDCVPGATGNDGCNTVSNSTIHSPWAYQSKISGSPANTIYSGGSMEGGVDLTALHLQGCFSTFLAETRSSPSIGAQLKDFLLGKFEACGSSLTTTPQDAAQADLTDSDVPPNGLPDVSIGGGSVQVTDAADFSVNGTDDFTGTLSFHLCGPIPDPDTCESGGVPIDAASGTNPVEADGIYHSVAATLTEAGRYCWRSDFVSGTEGVPDATDSSAGECFEVLPVTPGLDTQAVDENGADQTDPVPFGGSVYDKATLSGAATGPGIDGPGDVNGDYKSINPVTPGPDPGGTITFTLKGPDGATPDCDTNATGTGATNPQDVTVDDGNGDYFTAAFTPGAPGVYHWVASYGGDSPNTLSAGHNADCTDTGEDVTVEQIPTDIKTQQSWYPNDTATITADTGDLAAGGTVEFSLYDNATCEGEAFYTETSAALTGGSPSEEVSTSNTTVPITTLYDDPAGSLTGQYSWKVVYTPDSNDTSHTGKQSSCDAEHFNITYTNDAGPGSDLP